MKRLQRGFFSSKAEVIFLLTQQAITCSKFTIETLEHGLKYAQS